MKKPQRRHLSYEQRFMEALLGLCDGKDIAVLNRILREELGWTEKIFKRERDKLLDKGLIAARPGQGGKTQFINFKEINKTNTKKAFISYSHADEELKDKLLIHLKPLERLGLIGAWNDRKIMPGDNFEKQINSNIESADIIIFLVSSDFLASRYCYEIEMQKALERFEIDDVRIIPIILRPCFWSQTVISKFLASTKDAKPVTSYGDLDEAFAEVTSKIFELLTHKP